MVELPDDEVEAVAQAAVAAVRAGGGVGEVAEAMLPELRLVAARVRAEAVADREQLRADAETLRDMAPGDTMVGDTLCEIADRLELLAAGSVPVVTPPDAPCIECEHLESEHDMGRDRDCRALVTYRHEMPCVDGKSLVGRSQSECDRCPGFTLGPVATPTEPCPCAACAIQPRIDDGRCRCDTCIRSAIWHPESTCVCRLCEFARSIAASPVPAEQPHPWFRETPESLALLAAERAEVQEAEHG